MTDDVCTIVERYSIALLRLSGEKIVMRVRGVGVEVWGSSTVLAVNRFKNAEQLNDLSINRQLQKNIPHIFFSTVGFEHRSKQSFVLTFSFHGIPS